ncbi:MAG: hypothetical protein AB1752_01035 [Candidatus Zixiibacteriota bacterium]
MNDPKLISRPEDLPEQGGIFWFAGGVPERSLPKPCVACLEFLAELSEAELAQLVRRAKAHVKAPVPQPPQTSE